MQVEGGGHCLGRYDDHQYDAGKPELLQGKLESGKAVSHQSAYGNLQQCHRQRDQDRVQHGFSEVHKLHGKFIVVRGEMGRHRYDSGVIQIPLLHEADGNFVEYGLQNQKAHAEQQHHPDNLICKIEGCLFQQISAGFSVPFPETVSLSSSLSHNSKPPLK